VPDPAIIADTGPLVAFLVADDSYHPWAVERFKELRAPFLTCEPVLTETYHLLHRLRMGEQRFFELLGRGLLRVEFDLVAEHAALAALTAKYRDLPMSLADACLVRMVEQHPGSTVFTVDRHFRVYRHHGRRHIPTIMPPA
jgi:uncharacterized protein